MAAIWSLLPLALTLWTLVAFLVTYLMSYRFGHLQMDRPFLSASIDYAPESCIGSLALSITGMIFLIIGVLRWRLALYALRTKHRGTNPWLVHMSLFLCFTITVCLIGVGAFQYHNDSVAHLTFAMLLFVTINMYLVVMLRIDAVLEHVPRRTRCTRIILTLLSMLTTASTIVSYSLPYEVDKTISASSEIAMVVLFLFQLLTYGHELRRTSILFRASHEKDRRLILAGESTDSDSDVDIV